MPQGQTWVEALPPGDEDEATPKPARSGDGVSPISSRRTSRRGLGGAPRGGRSIPTDARRRSAPARTAYRFGINLVMYELTGNYKADQVHVPALLERLGQ